MQNMSLFYRVEKKDALPVLHIMYWPSSGVGTDK